MFQIISILEMSVDQATSILMILMLIIGSFLFMGIGAIQVGENDDVYLHKLVIRIMSLFLDVHVCGIQVKEKRNSHILQLYDQHYI